MGFRRKQLIFFRRRQCARLGYGRIPGRAGVGTRRAAAVRPAVYRPGIHTGRPTPVRVRLGRKRFRVHVVVIRQTQRA